MTKTIFALISLIWAASAYAADPVSAFEKFVAKASDQTAKISPVYPATQPGTWARAFGEISDVKFDVKKTDSLIAPIIGEVTFVLLVARQGPFTSEAEAKGAAREAASGKANRMDVALRYRWRDGAWRFLDGSELTTYGGVLATMATSRGKVERADLTMPGSMLRPWHQ